jgi:hypothetical protein
MNVNRRRRARRVAPETPAVSDVSLTDNVITVKLNVGRGSKQLLEEMARDSNSSSIANTVGAAVRIARVLQEQAKEGYSEVMVRNPATLDKRILLIDFLEPIEQSA